MLRHIFCAIFHSVESDEKHSLKSWGYKNSIVSLKRLWINCGIPVYAPTKAPYFCFMLYLNFQRHLFCLAPYLNYYILLISLRLGLVLQIKELYAFILIFRLQYIIPGNQVWDLSFKKYYCLKKYVVVLILKMSFFGLPVGQFWFYFLPSNLQYILHSRYIVYNVCICMFTIVNLTRIPRLMWDVLYHTTSTMSSWGHSIV